MLKAEKVLKSMRKSLERKKMKKWRGRGGVKLTL